MESSLPAPRKGVLNVIDLHINQAGQEAFPEIGTIARLSSLSRRTVIAHLKALDGVWLTKQRRGFKWRKWKCLAYVPRFPDDEDPFDLEVQQLHASEVQQLHASKGTLHKMKNSPNPSAHAEGDDLKNWFTTEFWKKYPRKEAESSALRALRKLGITEAERPLILAAIDKLADRHAPRASRWIKQAPWRSRARVEPTCVYCGGVACSTSTRGSGAWVCRAPACRDRDLFRDQPQR